MVNIDLDTRFDVAPNIADWYYCAIIERGDGETDYVDGYAAGAEPTMEAFQEHTRCRHAWIAGMMHVDDEDVAAVAASRPVVCEDCDRSYADRDRAPLDIIEWEVKQTPQSRL